MKLNHVKRSVVVLAAVFAAMSTSAVADSMGSKAVQLSDAELDGITAGFAQVIVVNPGNASVLNANESFSRAVCVNCPELELPPSTGPAFGVVTVENPGKKGVFAQIIGKPHFPF